eukprot:1837229-Pleurochrysis_carterae.AAC.1
MEKLRAFKLATASEDDCARLLCCTAPSRARVHRRAHACTVARTRAHACTHTRMSEHTHSRKCAHVALMTLQSRCVQSRAHVHFRACIRTHSRMRQHRERVAS